LKIEIGLEIECGPNWPRRYVLVSSASMVSSAVAASNGEPSMGLAAMTAAERAPPPPSPLVSLCWRDVKITASVVGVTSVHDYDGEIFPCLDERLPHRKGIKTAASAAAAAGSSDAIPIRPQALVSRVHIPSAAKAPRGDVASVVQAQKPQAKPLTPPAPASAKQAQPSSATVVTRDHTPAEVEAMARTATKHCPICKKGFTKTTYLKRHILSHSKVKPYNCDICGWGESDPTQ